MANDQKVMCSNPETIYWMDVSDANYYINIDKCNKNKDSQMGHTNKIFGQKYKHTYIESVN